MTTEKSIATRRFFGFVCFFTSQFFIFQQLSPGAERPANMEVAGHNQNTYKEVQAINPDYRNTGFDRGHLNPNSYQCDNARVATFTLTNAVPLDPCFNEITWTKMEQRSKKVMKDLCDFPGAQRFFVTGAVPRNRMIPNQEHDLESDRERAYNRVSVPSRMWTAACCDASEASEEDRGKGFSFAYHGENKIESSPAVLSVEYLEKALTDWYNPGNEVKIFTDDCNAGSENSKKALAEIIIPVNTMMANSVQKVSNMKESTLPAKKRMTIRAIDKAIKGKGPVSSANWALVNADIGMLLNRDEVADYRTKVGEFGLSLLLIWTPHIDTTKGNQYVHVELDKIVTSSSRTVVYGNKNVASSDHGKGGKQLYRYSFRHRSLDASKQEQGIGFANRLVELSQQRPEKIGHENDDEDGYDVADKDVYQVVLEASHDGAITVQGDRCRQGMKCDYHGREIKWCYVNWDGFWGRCCVDECLKLPSKGYPVCRVNPSESAPTVPCSITSSMIAVTGRRCLQDHPCGLHRQDYYWCYTAITGGMNTRWDYCCQSWHSCAEHGESYKWCYTGKKAGTGREKCFY